MNTLHVILRTYTGANSVNVERYGTKRPFCDSKRELVLTCLNSLLSSLGEKGVVHVLDDHSPKEDTEAIQNLLRSYSDVHQFVSLEKKGSGYSIESALLYGRDKGFPLMYFCEDDYLHLPHTISSMLDCYERYRSIVHPEDYFDRYFSNNANDLYPSKISLGTYNYWRTIRHTTFTFMVEKRILQQYWDIYMKAAQLNQEQPGVGWEGVTVNKIYESELCLSPMPSLTAHIRPLGPLPPFVDWQKVFEENKKEALSRIVESRKL